MAAVWETKRQNASQRWEGVAPPQPPPLPAHLSFPRLRVARYFANSQKCGPADTDD